jgi:putative ABC transport system substrate-binding protein
VRRREFIGFFGGAAAWPLAAGARQPGKAPVIGFLATGSGAAWGEWVAAFVRRLRDLGWVDGASVAVEVRWADGQTERIAEIASEFAHRKANIIVTSGLAVPTLQRAAPDIPVVFAIANEPINTGLVANLARPGGNVTGLSLQSSDVAPKRVEILREIVPGLRWLAILTNARYPASVLEMEMVRAIVSGLGVEVTIAKVERADELGSAFETLDSRVDALYVCADPLMQSNRVRISTLALVARLPAVHGNREYVEVGGLVSYGPNFPYLFRRAAEYTDKILRGAKPGDLPVEQPTNFDLVINMRTAKALGLEIPPILLARADEVIE